MRIPTEPVMGIPLIGSLFAVTESAIVRQGSLRGELERLLRAEMDNVQGGTFKGQRCLELERRLSAAQADRDRALVALAARQAAATAALAGQQRTARAAVRTRVRPVRAARVVPALGPAWGPEGVTATARFMAPTTREAALCGRHSQAGLGNEINFLCLLVAWPDVRELVGNAPAGRYLAGHEHHARPARGGLRLPLEGGHRRLLRALHAAVLPGRA